MCDFMAACWRLELIICGQGSIAVVHAVAGPSLAKRMAKFKVDVTKAGEGEMDPLRVFATSLTSGLAELLRFTFTYVDLALAGVSVVLVIYYIVTRNWIASNLLALSLSVNAISLMELDSFVTGSIMLGGLFLYDIFWVFGSEVMVSVARNFDAPIKIVWPKNLVAGLSALLTDVAALLTSRKSSSLLVMPWNSGSALSKITWQFTMLGLGDIVIPGIFVALALRYDQHVAVTASPGLHFTRRYTKFDKPYFRATFIAYVAGLATTMAVMHVFKAAQPALLYLSPACVSAVGIQSLLRGEWKQVWSWKDAEEEEEEDKQAADQKKARRKSGGADKTGDAPANSTATEKDYDADGERRSTRRRKASLKGR